MKTSLLKLLQCPFCGGTLVSSKVCQESETGLEYGILSCSLCSLKYPVVAGIPVLFNEHQSVDVYDDTTVKTDFTGPQVATIIKLIEENKLEGALQILINPQHCRFHLPALRKLITPLKLKYASKLVSRLEGYYGYHALSDWRKRIIQLINDDSNETTALDVLDLYYQEQYKHELGIYFTYRFGQPRHLVALSLARLLGVGNGPVLDIACGVGHMTHYLTSDRPDRTVIGLNRNFFELFIAKKYIAPTAEFVCCLADNPLPFQNEAFFGLFCSDAFHLFLNRLAAVREMKRLIKSDGIIVLTRFGNALIEPYEGYELTPTGYKSLFADMPYVLVSESTVLEQYLQKQSPNLLRDNDNTCLNQEKWLSLVASHRTDIWQEPTTFEAWPHALGRLQINPLYVEKDRDERAATYNFTFPSEWFAFENRHYSLYAPKEIRIPHHILDMLATGERTAEMEALIKQCVLLGMPDRYL